MLRRTLIGACVLALTLGAWVVDRGRPGQPAWAMGALGAVLLFGALHELLVMGGAGLPRRAVVVGAGLCWLVVVAAAGLPAEALPAALPGLGDPTLAGGLIALSLASGVLLAVLMGRGPGPAVARLSRNPFFAVAWAGGLAALIAALLAGRVELVLGLVLTTKSSDIGGYFLGKTLGRRKLAPTISPGKTVAGAVGGVLLPAVVAALLLPGVDATMPWHGGRSATLAAGPWSAALLGAVLGVVAIVSDLGESLVKRALGVKDSGRVFGESGGFLDLADSLLLVAPAALAYTAALA